MAALDVEGEAGPARREPAPDRPLGLAVCVDVGEIERTAARLVEPVEEPRRDPVVAKAGAAEDEPVEVVAVHWSGSGAEE